MMLALGSYQDLKFTENSQYLYQRRRSREWSVFTSEKESGQAKGQAAEDLALLHSSLLFPPISSSTSFPNLIIMRN